MKISRYTWATLPLWIIPVIIGFHAIIAGIVAFWICAYISYGAYRVAFFIHRGKAMTFEEWQIGLVESFIDVY